MLCTGGSEVKQRPRALLGELWLDAIPSSNSARESTSTVREIRSLSLEKPEKHSQKDMHYSRFLIYLRNHQNSLSHPKILAFFSLMQLSETLWTEIPCT